MNRRRFFLAPLCLLPLPALAGVMALAKAPTSARQFKDFEELIGAVETEKLRKKAAQTTRGIQVFWDTKEHLEVLAPPKWKRVGNSGLWINTEFEKEIAKWKNS